MSTHLQPNPDLLNKQFKLKDQAKPVNPELEKKRLGFKSLIHKDPSFDNYLQYLKFLDAHTMFKKQFNRVLKDFLTAFRRDETVKRKLVYLEYWLRLENEDIYQYVVNINELLVNEIGTSFPVLYSTWFKGLEAKGNLKEAEKALMLGVEKTGDDKLIKMLNDFKQNLEDRQDLENSRSASNKAKGKSKVLKDGFKLTSGQPKISSGNKPVPDLNDVNAKEAMSDILSMFNTTDDVSSCGKMDVDCQDKMKGVFIYKPEDDETISRQVFQRKTNKLRIGVFHDEIDDEFSHKAASTSMISKESKSFVNESIDLGLDMEIECEPLDPTDPIVRQRILEKVNHKNSNSVVIDLQSESTVYPKLEQILNSNSFSKAFKTVRGRRLVVDKIISQNADFQTLLCKDVIDGQLTLLKAARPSQIWEYYIYQKLAGREIVCNLVSFCASNDSSILELEYHPSQTLLSTFVKNNQDMSEVVVYNVALEIIKAVHKFHELGFIHCDIHQDNIIMEDNRGWKLCNFEASIDLSAFPMNQLFRMEPNEDEAALECFEMQKGLAWKYEPDWFQVAMVVHELKFPGKGFGVINSSEFSRPIQKIAQECDEKWQDLFKMLLNVDSEQNISKFLSSL